MIDCVVLSGDSVLGDPHSKWLCQLSDSIPRRQSCFCLVNQGHVVHGRVVPVGESFVVSAKRSPIPDQCIACCVIEGERKVILPYASAEEAVEAASNACSLGSLARVELQPIS
jgi:hypothetical protein